MDYRVEEFSRPEYWSGYTFPSPGDLPDPELKPRSPTLQVLYQLSHRGSPRILEWVAYPFYRGLSYPGIKLDSPASQADSLPTELSGKLKKKKNGDIYCAHDWRSHYGKISNLSTCIHKFNFILIKNLIRNLCKYKQFDSKI